MSTISIQRKLNMSRDEVKKLAEKVGEKLGNKYGVCFTWADYDAEIDGPGVSGACNVGEGEIGIELRLGFLAMPFKGKIEEEVKRYLDKLA